MGNQEGNNVTIIDVAKAAGISVATVSRVLSGSDYPVSKKSRQKVLDAAKEVGYSPNLLGKMLKTNKNPAVGIIISSFQNPFYNQIIMGIEHAASKRGYDAQIFSSQRDPLIERKLISNFMQKRVMGLMISSIDDSPESLEKYILSGGKACIFESNFVDIDNLINAKADMIGAGQMAMEYLISQNHRQIAILTTPLNKQSRKLTLDGCRLAMYKHSLELTGDDIIVAPTEYEPDNGLYEFDAGIYLAKELLKRKKKYTAVIAINDLIAYGVIQGFKKEGIKVPDDISVIGFDDIPYSSMITPELTTVRLPSRVLGQKAADILIDSLETGENVNGLSISFKNEIVVRDSVKSLSR